jgi:hypothetical protein
MATKCGKPVTQGVPASAEPESVFGYMSGTMTIKGDVVAGIEEPWTSDAGDRDERVPAPRKTSRGRRSPSGK